MKFWKRKKKTDEINPKSIIYFKKGDNLLEKFIEAWWMKEVYGWSYLVFLTGESEDKD